MPKRINFTTEEVKTIFQMKMKGYTVREIADKLGRSKKSIQSFVDRYRLSPDGSTSPREPGQKPQFTKRKGGGLYVTPHKELPDAKEALDAVPETKLTTNDTSSYFDEVNEAFGDFAKIETAPGFVKEPKKVTVVPRVSTVLKSLSSYPAIELIKNLYERGYRIEDNTLVCYTRNVVKLNEILVNG